MFEFKGKWTFCDIIKNMRNNLFVFTKRIWLIIVFIFITIVFGFIVFQFPQLIKFFGSNKKIFTIIHVASMSFGLVCASLCDLFFFKFLKDYKISKFEKEILDFLSNVMWISLFIVGISGIALFVPNSEKFLNSSKFLLKGIVVTAIILNGLFLNLIISPRLKDIDFAKKYSKTKFKKIGFVLGAVSIISWWSAFILGSFRSLPFNFNELLFFYFGILFFGISISLMVERYFYRK